MTNEATIMTFCMLSVESYMRCMIGRFWFSSIEKCMPIISLGQRFGRFWSDSVWLGCVPKFR